MQKNIKIVFLVGGPLTNRWLSYYHLDELSQVFDVEFWDCGALIRHPYKVSGIQERNYSYTIVDENSLFLNLRRMPQNAMLMPEIGFVDENYELLKTISKYIHNCVIIDIWSFNLLQTLRDQSDKSFKARLKALRRLVKSSFKPPISVDSDSNKCKKLFRMFEISYRPDAKYSINHTDYEKYLEVRDGERIVEEPYIVYVGQYYPLHPEYATIEPNVDFASLVEPFYASLGRFFDKVEKQYGMPVVLAEHPSGNFSNNPFGNRKIIFYKTAELVRDAQYVCMHCSNSFSFVALFDKPVAFLDCEALQVSHNVGGRTREFARILNNPVVDMDTVDDCSGIFKPIDKSIRKQFLHGFSDTGRVENNVDLLIQHFQSIANEIKK